MNETPQIEIPVAKPARPKPASPCRLIVYFVGITALVCVAGVVGLGLLSIDVPDVLATTLATAIGALSGLLRSKD